MDYQSKYDELDNIISTLRILVNETTDKNYIHVLNEIMFEAQDEMSEVGEKLQKEYEAEEREMNRQYQMSRI